MHATMNRSFNVSRVSSLPPIAGGGVGNPHKRSSSSSTISGQILQPSTATCNKSRERVRFRQGLFLALLEQNAEQAHVATENIRNKTR